MRIPHHSVGGPREKLLAQLYINKIQQDETVCRYLFTPNLLYMFRVSIAPFSRST